MSEKNLKPLVFLHPLSETLKKLYEIMSENAESEGIEIYDVENPQEGTQLIPVIGQSLIMASSPKSCAMLLQPTRRVIKKLETKTILLSSKAIPRKTLEKFMKIGLTECVVEPVNPKTLLYKVRLQLRSIATKKESQELALKDSQKANQNKNAKDAKQAKDKNKDSELEEDQEQTSSTKQNSEEKQSQTTSLGQGTETQDEEETGLAEQAKGTASEDLYARKKKKKRVHDEEGGDLYETNPKEKKQVDADDDLYHTSSEDKEQEDDNLRATGQVDEITGHYEGDDNDDNHIETHNKNDSQYQDEEIETHYKGELDTTTEEEEEQEEPDEFDPELELENIKNAIKKKASEEVNQDTQKDKSLVEMEEQQTHESQRKGYEDAPEEMGSDTQYEEGDLGGHYKGEINEQVDESEDEVTKTKSDSLFDEEEDQKSDSTVDNLGQQHHTGKGSVDHIENDDLSADTQTDHQDEGGHLSGDIDTDVYSESDEQERQVNESQVDHMDDDIHGSDSAGPDHIETKATQRSMGLDEEEQGDLSGESGIDHIEEEDATGEGSKADDIDGYLRGGAAKKDVDEEEEPRKKKPSLDMGTHDENNDRDKFHEDDGMLKSDSTRSEEEEEKDKKKRESLDFEAEDDGYRKKKPELEFAPLENDRKDPDQEEDEDKKKRNKGYQEEEDGEWSGDFKTEHHTDEEANKADAKADHIETHYSNKKSVRHDENGYGKDWKPLREDEEKDKPEFKKQDHSKEELADGDTIDYSKIKEEFSDIEYGSDQKEKKPYSFESESAEVATVTKTVISPDGKIEEMQFEQVPEDIDPDETFVYEPDSKGIENLISILNLYYDKDSEENDIIDSIIQRALEIYQCQLVFYKKVNQKLHTLGTNPEELSSEQIEAGQTSTVPTWSDTSFQSEDNMFVFPYFDGPNQLGFVVATFTSHIDEKQGLNLEALLESARGVYLTQVKQQNIRSSKQNKKDNNVGFWGSLFKKIAG